MNEDIIKKLPSKNDQKFSPGNNLKNKNVENTQPLATNKHPGSDTAVDKDIGTFLFLYEQNPAKAYKFLMKLKDKFPNDSQVSKLAKEYFPNGIPGKTRDESDPMPPTNPPKPKPPPTHAVLPSTPVIKKGNTLKISYSRFASATSNLNSAFSTSDLRLPLKKIPVILTGILFIAVGYVYLDSYIQYKNEIQSVENNIKSGRYFAALNELQNLQQLYLEDEWITNKIIEIKLIIQDEKNRKLTAKNTKIAAELFNRGYYERSIKYFKQALKTDPENEKLHSYLEEAQKRQKKRELHKQKKQAERNNKIEYLSQEANYFMDVRDWDKAKNLWLQVLQLDPKNREAVSGIKEIEFQENNDYVSPGAGNQGHNVTSTDDDQDRIEKGIVYYQRKIDKYKNLIDIAEKRLATIKLSLRTKNLPSKEKEKLLNEKLFVLKKIERFHVEIWNIKMKAAADDIPIVRLQ